MSALISVPSSSGDILIEVDRAGASASVMRGAGGGPLEKATASFEDSWARIRPVATAIIMQLGDMVDGTDEVKVTFGVKFGADAGVFIASASTEANFAIEITWKKPAPKRDGLDHG
jgi:hypothetical protein